MKPADPFNAEERERYARHFQLPGFGSEGQRRLRAASVLVVGAGGLGSPALLYLAAAGVGRLGIADFDIVERSNLQRQVLFGESDIGKVKAAVACERVRMQNPNVLTDEISVRITAANARDIVGRSDLVGGSDIVGGYDLVLDGTDNFATRYLLSDVCVLLDKPLIYGSVYRHEGQVSVFGGAGGPCYRCLFPNPPSPDLMPSCAEGGVLGVLPGIIGSLQALEAIKVLAEVGEPLRGRTLQFDALSATFREYTFEASADCPACSGSLERGSLERGSLERWSVGALERVRGRHCEERSDEAISLERWSVGALEPAGTHQPLPDSLINTSPPDMSPEILPAELHRRVGSGDAPRLIDVRAPREHEACNIGGTLVPLNQLEAFADAGNLRPDEEVVVYCRSGRRSEAAVQYLRQRGFENARNLVGGLESWRREIDPALPLY